MSEDQATLDTRLAHAVRNSDAARVEDLLRQGADIFTKGPGGATLLAASVRAGERAAKSRETSVSGRMFADAERKVADLMRARAAALPPAALALDEASALRRLDALNHHLAQAAPEALGGPGFTAVLAEAVRRDDAEVVTLLLEGGMSADIRCMAGDRRWEGYSVLGLAAACGCPEALGVLLAHGATVDARQPADWGRAADATPLMLAARTSCLAALKQLIGAGADISLTDAGGHGVLRHAQDAKQKRNITFLEKCLEKRDTAAELDLCAAAAAGISYRVRALLDQGVDPDQRDTAGRTPLMLAAGAGRSKVVRLLCQAGADVNAVGSDHSAGDLWGFAIASRNADVIGCLLAHGLDPNAARGELPPPLLLAVRNANKQIIRLLLDHGADPAGPVPAPLVEKVQASQARLAASVAAARGLTVVPSSPADDVATVLDFVARFEARSVHEFLLAAHVAATGIGDLPFYVKLRNLLGTCEARADAAFLEEAQRIGEVLHSTPQRWRRRKGALTFFASPARAFGPADEQAPTAGAPAETMLRRLQHKAAERGYTLINAGLPLGRKSAAQLVLFPLDEPLAALVACGTNATNYGIGTREIVSWCEETRRETPLAVVSAGFDFVELSFPPPITDSVALARRLAVFCRDLQVKTDDEAGIAAFARQLEERGTCFLWWD